MDIVIGYRLLSWRYQGYDEYQYRSEKGFHSIEFIELRDPSGSFNGLEGYDL
jgi:hypothetical protein